MTLQCQKYMRKGQKKHCLTLALKMDISFCEFNFLLHLFHEFLSTRSEVEFDRGLQNVIVRPQSMTEITLIKLVVGIIKLKKRASERLYTREFNLVTVSQRPINQSVTVDDFRYIELPNFQERTSAIRSSFEKNYDAKINTYFTC